MMTPEVVHFTFALRLHQETYKVLKQKKTIEICCPGLFFFQGHKGVKIAGQYDVVIIDVAWRIRRWKWKE